MYTKPHGAIHFFGPRSTTLLTLRCLPRPLRSPTLATLLPRLIIIPRAALIFEPKAVTFPVKSANRQVLVRFDAVVYSLFLLGPKLEILNAWLTAIVEARFDLALVLVAVVGEGDVKGEDDDGVAGAV